MTSVDSRRAARTAFWSALLAGVLTLAGCLGVFSVASVALGSGMWQSVVAVLLAVAFVIPLHRWLSPRMHELAEQQHDAYEAVRSISSAGVEPSSSARAIAEALNLPWVEVDTASVDSFGTPVPGAARVELAIAFRDETFGAVRTAERRAGSRLSQADLNVLRELAAQLGMRLAAERATVRAEMARTEVVTAREEERRRMRRDLHDGLAPSLASIQLQLKAAQRRLADDDPIQSELGGMIEDVRDASADLRRLVYELRPPLLDELGLAVALQRQFETIKQPAITVSVDPVEMPAAVEVAAFRIASEAVHNAVKHSGAHEVHVAVTSDGERLHVVISDDGVGIRPDVVAGLGLTAMRDRAEELGGTLTVESSADGGTRVTASIGLHR